MCGERFWRSPTRRWRQTDGLLSTLVPSPIKRQGGATGNELEPGLGFAAGAAVAHAGGAAPAVDAESVALVDIDGRRRATRLDDGGVGDDLPERSLGKLRDDYLELHFNASDVCLHRLPTFPVPPEPRSLMPHPDSQGLIVSWSGARVGVH